MINEQRQYIWRIFVILKNHLLKYNMLHSRYIPYFRALETPFYFYDLDILHKTLEHLKISAQNYDYHIHYALKANANERILKIIRDYGFGADCVSGNEVKRALEIGFEPEKVVFAGVGKSDPEISFAVDNSIFCFNSESIEEISIINEIAKKINKTVPVSLRLNPDIDAVTHNYLTTGLNENKFGIPLTFLDKVISGIKNLSYIRIIGLHFHIGSQITELSPYIKLCKKINQIQEDLLTKHQLQLEHINLGGGLGINYTEPERELIPDFGKFFDTIHEHLKPMQGQKIHFEPGRSVIAQSGSLISRVLYVKKGINKEFVILDAGMTDLIRPALYGAHHKIENLSKQNLNAENFVYDVVGPVCETSDSFASNIMLPLTEREDLIAIRSAGAYGEIMVSQYNLRNKPKSIYSDELIADSEKG
jgi:diaminopimelate decarboxylase